VLLSLLSLLSQLSLLSLIWSDNRRLVVVRVAEFDPVAGVARVGLAPPSRSVARQALGFLRAVATPSAPRPNTVRKVTRVALVVERELFDGVVADAELVELARGVPLAVAPLAGDGRRVRGVAAGQVITVV